MAWSRFSARSKVLTLDRFAEIFGLNLVAFNQGTFEPVCHYGCLAGCNEFWYQNGFQAGASHITRDDLAQAIVDAERDLRNFWGVPICPEEKCVTLPYNGGCGPLDTYVYGNNIRSLPGVLGQPLSGRSKRNGLYLLRDEPVRAWGRQTLLDYGPVEVTIYDHNGDEYTSKNGVDCPKRIEISTEVASDVQECEIEVYHVGHVGERAYRIEPSLVEIDEGVVTITIDPWRAVRVDLWEDPAECCICLNSGATPIIDLLDPAAYPDELVIARRYFDVTVPAVQFGWHGGHGCACGSCDLCRLTYCPGCLVSGTSSVQGAVYAVRGAWDEDEGAWCVDRSCAPCARDPDFVKIYYWHGYMADDGCAQGPCFDCGEAEQIVAMLAASRLLKSVCHCSCGKTADRFAELQATMNYTSRNEGSYYLTFSMAENPFGTRRGEVDAFRRALQIKRHLPGATVTTGAL